MSYQSNIDWGWNNFDPPQQSQCYAFIISMDPPLFRGIKTGHECITEGIRSARAGDRGRALRWLEACQCHNDDARDEIHQAGNAAIDYAVATYGGQIP